MKMNLIIIGALLLLQAAGCETTRQSATADSGNNGTGRATVSTTPANRSTNTTNNNMPASIPTTGMESTSSTSGQTVNPAQTGQTATTGGQAGTTGQVVQPGIPQQPNQPTMGNPQNNTVNPSISNTQPNTTMNNSQDPYINAPANVQGVFSSRFPTASDVKWSYYDSTKVPIDWDLTGWPRLSNRDYAVMYNVDGATNYSWYDAQGNWVGSTSAMKDFMSLPTPVTKMLSTKYAGYKIVEVHTEMYKDQSGYEIEMNKGTDKVKMLVDATGNILKLKTKTTDSNGNMNKEKIKN